MLLIVHVPKTAGTSLRVAITRKLGNRRMAFDYGEYSELTSPLVLKHMYDPGQRNDPGALIERLSENGCVALAGHFPLSRYSGYIQPDKVIAFVREPLVRACSEYLHRSADGSFSGSLGDFFDTSDFQDLQSKTLAGRTGEEFVGITEHYRESIRMINQRFQLGIRCRRDNTGPVGGGARMAQQLDPALRERFYALNQQDVLLYRAALERFSGARRFRFLDIFG
jgi:hypothetical protein